MQRAFVATGLAGALVFFVAACSASSGTSSSTSSDSSSQPQQLAVTSAVLNEVRANVKTHEVADPAITVAPLVRKPPTGKTIQYISCPISACQVAGAGLEAAAKAVGWKVNVIVPQFNPSSIQDAWNSVVQNPGDAVVAVGLVPNAAIATQLAALKAKGIPVVQDASPSLPSGAYIGDTAPPNEFAEQGALMADWVIADSGGHTAKVAFFTDPTQAILANQRLGFIAEMKAKCPSCTVSVQAANLATGVGTTIPPQVVSFVQSHPDFKYIYIDSGDDAAGVAQALQAAGLLSKVKLITRNAQATNIQNIAAGLETMGCTNESYESGWLLMDMLIRHFEGMTFNPTPVGVLHIITKANVPANTHVPYTAPGYQADYLKAWHLT